MSIQRCVTYGRVGSKSIRFRGFNLYIFGVKVYELKPRTRDGIYTWRLARCLMTRSGRYPSGRLIGDAMAYAESERMQFMPHIRQGTVQPLSDIQLLALGATDDQSE